MDLKNFYSITKPIYFILIALVISSCGTYQYSGNVNDGIYNSNISSQNAVVVETKEVNNKADIVQHLEHQDHYNYHNSHMYFVKAIINFYFFT